MIEKVTRGIKSMVAMDGNNKLLNSFLSAIGGAALSMLITYSTSVASNREQISILSTKVDNLTTTIEKGLEDNYSGADAARDLAPIREKLREIQIHDKEIEAKLDLHMQQRGMQ